jgi:hypothetical protein
MIAIMSDIFAAPKSRKGRKRGWGLYKEKYKGTRRLPMKICTFAMNAEGLDRSIN